MQEYFFLKIICKNICISGIDSSVDEYGTQLKKLNILEVFFKRSPLLLYFKKQNHRVQTKFGAHAQNHWTKHKLAKLLITRLNHMRFIHGIG